ncbi:coagulation factor VII isoform X1 [Heteronotia binoei]|uniref:coagulation factor VII isoform X1 n=1 Tax=Heteronotia binoei TaxID=13085 RepID=UPI00292CF2D5|nr:coagulation factor VII isoform X1 [Heteronotia binoei]
MVSYHHSILFFFFFLVYPLLLTAVFLNHEEASSMLQRKKRANSFLEELKAGSLERECLEEQCSQEEAREIFQDDKRTVSNVATERALQNCKSNPCQNGGTCSGHYKTYMCLCPVGYEGRNCETAEIEKLKCIYDNGNCHHYCRDTPTTERECFCAKGYRLASDEISCIPEDDYPCGKIPILAQRNESQGGRIVGGHVCPPGECPWQVLLIDGVKQKCGGVLLAPSWVVTAAHCLDHTHPRVLRIKLGEYDRDYEEEAEQERRVAEIIIHEQYIPKKTDNDIALLRLDKPVNFTDYVIPICLPEQQFAATVLSSIKFSTVSGWGRLIEGGATSSLLLRVNLPQIKTKECIQHTNFNITRNMFCAGYLTGTKDACEGDSGGPHATQYKNTWFLTGIVSWGKGCAAEGTYGVYTKVSRYIEWLNNHMSH